MIESLNPATEKILKTFKPYNTAEIKSALNTAQKFFLKWKEVSIEERAMLMRKAAAVLRQNKKRYAAIMTSEMGKPITQSLGEVEKCAWVCDYYALNANKFLEEEFVKTENLKSYARFDPLGIILAVMPWNFPFWQLFRFAAPALMAGNAILLKHASNVPQSALAIEEVFLKAGFQKGAFKTLLIESSKTAELISDMRVRGVTLTGSEGAGRSIGESAGRNLKKAVLELGGSDPFIVLQDADLKQAALIAARSRLINSGQSCIAAKRFIVEKNVYKDFMELFSANMKAFKVGDPMKNDTEVGPLARKDLQEEVSQQVESSIKAGAKLILGGKKINQKGFFYPPTILADVKKGMLCYDEEIFGPVASVISAEDEDHAVSIANDSNFGLGASLWTKDFKKAENLARKIEAGAVFVNDYVKSDPRLPFGGIKNSGYGRELGIYGIREFVNVKTVVIK